ncbi:MAG TPA: high-affinity nickel-transport family protein [Polyangiaceae bacterium]|nr:high-affinity nickel-transport family protein [Polyangiaceae bacterium]
MRHATDADHVVAVTTIVSRERSVRAAAPLGILWGVGHTLTILCVGGAIIVFGLVIPARVGLALELCVAFVLLLLGAVNLRAAARDGHARGTATSAPAQPGSEPPPEKRRARTSLRPVLVGVAHGLAGSAAVALLVLGTLRNSAWAIAYLVVFGVGTIAGMFLITAVFAVPVAAAAGRFERFHRALGIVTGLASILFGGFLVYRIGFVDGFFAAHPSWTPE